MNSIVLVLAIVTFISTLIGGLTIFRFKKSLPFFFAFAAGSLIAVAFLDILPESLNIAQSLQIPIRAIMLTVVCSFFGYSLLERYFLSHHFSENDEHGHIMGPIGAGSLIIHSLLDGAAIGTAFQVSPKIGVAVALAVIFHDFTDGINTVTLMLKNNQEKKKAFIFLILDALAPVIGVVLTSLIQFPEKILVFLLAIFVGEFIYIGATTLLPETHHHPSKKIIIAMALGMLLIGILTSFL